MPLLSECLRCLFLWIQFNTNGPSRGAWIPFPHRIITVSCDFVRGRILMTLFRLSVPICRHTHKLVMGM